MKFYVQQASPADILPCHFDCFQYQYARLVELPFDHTCFGGLTQDINCDSVRMEWNESIYM